jgi:GT2 family glycosyltransferase
LPEGTILAIGEVVICTKNRPAAIGRLLDALLAQTVRLPILVVDASDSDATAREVARLRSRYDRPLRHVAAEAGLTRQRMRAVELLLPDSHAVHFMDDDTVPEPEYVEALERAFERLPDALGVGGRITNLPAPKPGLLDRICLLAARQPGRVLPSGYATLGLLAPSTTAPVLVEWLSGCSMSYRVLAFAHVAFDTRMTGYSLGEDVDFGFRASRIGRLYVAPDARVSHVPSGGADGGGGADYVGIAADGLRQRHRLVCELRDHGLSVPAFWWATVCDIVLSAVRGLVRLRWFYLRKAGALVAAAIGVARSGVLPANPRIRW